MVSRRKLIGAFACGMLAGPVRRPASAAAVRRIGILGPSSAPSFVDIESETAPLRKLGWIEGRNLVVVRRYANGRADLLRPLANELVRMNVELIVAEGTAATLAARDATRSIPIVFASAGDPVRTGLVASLSRPGGNVTGYSIVTPELDTKRLAALRELVPSVVRVGVLDNSGNPYGAAVRSDTERVCRELGIEPIFVDIMTAADVSSAVDDVVRRGAQALLIPPDSVLYDKRAELMRAVLRHRLPTTVARLFIREEGALVSYANSETEHSERTASYVDRILRGAKPAELPVERPTQFRLIVNLRTANALGITVPQAMLSRADEVIE